jgi:hypothetical protein
MNSNKLIGPPSFKALESNPGVANEVWARPSILLRTERGGDPAFLSATKKKGRGIELLSSIPARFTAPSYKFVDDFN